MQIKSIVALTTFALVGAQSSASSASASGSASPSASASSSAATPTPTKTPLEICIAKNNCGNDVNCIAGCSNVPNPTASQAQSINQCVAGCNNTQPLEVYAACQAKCISQMITNQTIPSSSGGSGGKNGTSPSSGNSAAGKTQVYATAMGALTLFAMYISL
ncbi:hypothetical protein CONCODRAFT_70883 [Conidiobolus coronatus NRRL 28638]|uniref:Extracellular membrane protein CFEM domain-containing protein n=1 Tax=Conidiobolus coronatus (strain ATCC 28846 / CBS 209.66 / NRRL 28638) TaxID=796925 RepID=A0A137P5A6_CONC2|nr:hypothetical protein CONCODRAFT_70883 [Conidiobolus coronatus NRRL 28638]|eukprot:KXN70200.1 hypothetical protein CONCODRAFT_70883 [Conidiobolus coronatus NRRL 28638]